MGKIRPITEVELTLNLNCIQSVLSNNRQFIISKFPQLKILIIRQRLLAHDSRKDIGFINTSSAYVNSNASSYTEYCC